MTDKTDQTGVRLDKWLWAARFYKTRQLAVKAIKTGKILLYNQNTKPASNLRIGDILTIKRPPYTMQVEILGVSEKRGSANIAQALYQETAASIEQQQTLQQALAAQPKVQHDRRKPDKRVLRNSRNLKRGE